MLINNRVLLLNPYRRYIASEHGFGYQVPLGLVFVGGPLVDEGFDVKLLDADVEKLSIAKVLNFIKAFDPAAIGISHTGSTAGHPAVINTVKTIKAEMPHIKIVYGGVYPTFAYRQIIEKYKEIDYIARGEGEATSIDLFTALRDDRPINTVKGIVWRNDDEVVVNEPRPPIKNLDDYRPGWELVNWDRYKLLNKRAAGVQFGRGCIHSCDFCGQWIFWKKWRHMSPKAFVDQIEYLVVNYKIETIWPADEHFAANRDVLIEILEDLAKRNLNVTLSINTSVDAVVRDEDIMPLYKKAGVVFAAIGVESDNNAVVKKLGKNISYEQSCKAVKILQKNQIVATTNVIYGLEEESLKTLIRKCWRLLKMDPDFLNAMYLTPHFWTSAGSKVKDEIVMQHDLSKWDYRHQIVKTPNLSAFALFVGVKITETILHCRPKRFWRGLTSERSARWMSMYGFWRACHVWTMEIVEHSKNKLFRQKDFFRVPETRKNILPKKEVKNAHSGS